MSPRALPRIGAAPRANIIEVGIGLAAAGAGAVLGLAAERLAVGRPLLGRAPTARSREVMGDESALGSLRSVPTIVTSDDGTELYVEVDEPDQPDPDGLTVVFCHGYCNNLDAWHYQRAALRGKARMVLWDQRGHGRSQRGAEGSATVHQLGADLVHVLDATVPSGPLVLVGHSMGGMTIMALASRNPGLFEERVAGVGFVSTSSGGLAHHDLGLSKLGRTLMRLAPAALGLVSRAPGLVERGRRIGSDLEEVIVKKWSYASPVSAELIDFTARMIASTRIEVVSEFLPQFTSQQEHWALSTLEPIVSLVITGDHDLMIPPEHSEVIAEQLPRSELVLVRDGNHLVMLEHPEVVTPHVVALVGRAREDLPLDTRAERPLEGREKGLAS